MGGPAPLSEDDLLKLELKEFMKLLKNEGTLDRMEFMLDNGKPLRFAYVGGTAIPFNGDAAYYDTYLASSKKMAKAA